MLASVLHDGVVRDVAVGAYDLVVDVRLVRPSGPGAIAALFVPNDPKTLGAFAGGGAELVLHSFADQGSLFVPSHGRFFLDAFALARSPVAGFADQTQLGAFGWAMPLVGVYPWASRAARLALEGGYLLPTTAAQNVRGVVVMASIDLAPF